MFHRCIAALLFLFVALTAHATEEKPIPIVENLKACIQSDDEELSLGAMLVSVNINDYWILEPVVRGSIQETDTPWVQAIKAYTLACYTLEEEEALRFINAVPHDEENFQHLIDFESRVMRHPGSNILDKLFYYATNSNKPELEKLAVDKLNALLLVSDGWVSDYIRTNY